MSNTTDKVLLCGTHSKRLLEVPISVAVRLVHARTLMLDVVAREKYWATLPQHVWDAYIDYLIVSYQSI